MAALQEMPRQGTLTKQDLLNLRNFIIEAIEAPSHQNAAQLPVIKTTINLFYSPEVTALREKHRITDRVHNLSFEEMAYRKHKPIIEAMCRKAQDEAYGASPDEAIKDGPHHS